MKEIFWCKNCLNMSTRPRIEFDDKCWCNACQWMEEKTTMDWRLREKELIQLLDSELLWVQSPTVLEQRCTQGLQAIHLV